MKKKEPARRKTKENTIPDDGVVPYKLRRKFQCGLFDRNDPVKSLVIEKQSSSLAQVIGSINGILSCSPANAYIRIFEPSF